MKAVYIVDAARTAVGKYGGTLGTERPDDLAAFVIKEVLARNPSLDPLEIEDIIFGAANQSGEDNRNVARMAGLLAGLPISIPGVTVNRLCASGLQSIAMGAQAIASGDGEVYIAGGVESMSRAPFVMAKGYAAFSRATEMYDTTIGWRFTNPKLSKLHYPFAMGETAENVAEQWKISREAQDEFAHHSQVKYQAAHEANKFSEEILPYSIPQRKGEPIVFDKDEHPRLGSVEILGKLKPAFKADGSVTAGNSSGINDGAAALILASEDAVKKYNLTPIARFVSYAAAGVDPSIMGVGPVPATQKALKRAGLSVKDLDLIELNEAFASQSLACIQDLDLNTDIINVNGGSIAIGHPLGCSGARITTTLLHELKKRENARYGLATMCVGVGQGVAAIYERV